MEEKVILLSNDDGIYSPGLRATAEAVCDLGRVVIIAPSKQQTAMSRSIRGAADAKLIPIDFPVNGKNLEAYHSDCSPALMVHHGLKILFSEKNPDLLVTGINYGENIGANVTISATVGAALEGAACGIPALAMSKQTPPDAHHEYSEQDWQAAIYFTRMFSKTLLDQSLPEEVDVLKIDIPENAETTTPWRLTKVSRQTYYKKVFESPSLDCCIGDGKLIIEIDRTTLEKDSDVYAIAVDQVVSVTPLSLDITAGVQFDRVYHSLTVN